MLGNGALLLSKITNICYSCMILFTMKGVFMSNTKRMAFIMHLKPGMKAEYKKRHDEIWPELKELLKETGIVEYSIFLDEKTNTLFAFQKTAGTVSSQDLRDNPIVQKWWKYMSDIMETNSDYSPVMATIDEVFNL